MNERTYDAVIIGAGLTGLLTAYTLSKSGYQIAIIDKNRFTNPKNLTYDFRTTAIAEGSKSFLEKQKIWKKISEFAQPIEKIQVFDRNISNNLEFKNPHKKSFLGYIVKNKNLKKVFLNEIKTKPNIDLMANLELQSIETRTNISILRTSGLKLHTKLLIAADGKNSFVRKLKKNKIFEKNYRHNAFVVNLCHQNDHQNTAYEIFFKTGPLAILPMKKEFSNGFCSSIVWSHSEDFLCSLDKINNRLLKAILEEKLMRYTGKIKKIIAKKTFKLSAHINTSFFDDRLVYVGDAAHSIHPIAGQGWNIGVRDIKNLLNSINKGFSLGLDIGDKYICQNYNDKSFKDAFSLFQITDKINSIFLNDDLLFRKARNAGIYFIENNSKIKNSISNFAMGNFSDSF